MIIEHVAIWTDDLEGLKDYYVRFFNGRSNNKYVNEKKGFSSYFISFDSGTRLEIMSRNDVPDNLSDPSRQYKGIIHFAFALENRELVDAKAKELSAEGFAILSGPRITGDGYYEFETFDPDKNRIEVTSLI